MICSDFYHVCSNFVVISWLACFKYIINNIFRISPNVSMPLTKILHIREIYSFFSLKFFWLLHAIFVFEIAYFICCAFGITHFHWYAFHSNYFCANRPNMKDIETFSFFDMGFFLLPDITSHLSLYFISCFGLPCWYSIMQVGAERNHSGIRINNDPQCPPHINLFRKRLQQSEDVQAI